MKQRMAIFFSCFLSFFFNQHPSLTTSHRFHVLIFCLRGALLEWEINPCCLVYTPCPRCCPLSKTTEGSLASIQDIYSLYFAHVRSYLSPTVLDGCTDATLSRDFCFLSLSLSLRRWQRWWWWWWWALSWLWTCPGPIEDWAKSDRSRSYSPSPTSCRCCCVSEDAERLIGLRSTIG